MPKFLFDSVVGSLIRRLLAILGPILTENQLIDAEGWEKFVVWFIPFALSFAWSYIVRLFREEDAQQRAR